MREIGPFRLRNKCLLITYPQLNLDHTAQYIGEHFKWLYEKTIDFEYIICSKEKHEDGGNHYHVFFTAKTPVCTKDQRFFDFNFNDNIYHPNIQPIKKTPWKTVEYVMKDGDYWEYLPDNKPKCSFDNMSKKDKSKFLKEHDPLDLYEQGIVTPQQCANLIKAKRLIAQEALAKHKRKEKPIVMWYYGKTGTGKTRTAIEIAEDMGIDYWISHGEKLQWFDGYIGQQFVIIDDFRRNMCSFNYFLRLLDRYQMQVQVKGGYVNWIPKYIVITCPVDVDEAYTYFDFRSNEEKQWDNLDQLKRRIDDVICFDHMEQYPGRMLIDPGELRDENL